MMDKLFTDMSGIRTVSCRTVAHGHLHPPESTRSWSFCLLHWDGGSADEFTRAVAIIRSYDADERHLTALRNHTPTVVVFALMETAVLAIGFTAYPGSAAPSGGSEWACCAIARSAHPAHARLDRPDRGAMEVFTQALSDAPASILAKPLSLISASSWTLAACRAGATRR